MNNKSNYHSRDLPFVTILIYYPKINHILLAHQLLKKIGEKCYAYELVIVT